MRALRNLAAYKVLRVVGLNVYDILNYPEVLMTARAARSLEQRLAGAEPVNGAAMTGEPMTGEPMTGASASSESVAGQSGSEVPEGELGGGGGELA